MNDKKRATMLARMSLINPHFIDEAVYPENASSPAATRRARHRLFPRIAVAAALIAVCGSVTAIAANFFINRNTQKNYVESFAAESRLRLSYLLYG